MAKKWLVARWDNDGDARGVSVVSSQDEARIKASKESLATGLSPVSVFQEVETVKATIPSTITAVTE